MFSLPDDFLQEIRLKTVEYEDPSKRVKEDYLKRIKWLQSDFEEEKYQLKEVISHMTFGMLEDRLDSQYELFTKGDNCQFIIFLIHGKVNISMGNENGDL